VVALILTLADCIADRELKERPQGKVEKNKEGKV
jgi:hypothetical protein